ncbi:hypothetical protein JW823_06650 [bacterium]|nr:hypothetical protein [candidate division CSSED10-310 bacterium]
MLGLNASTRKIKRLLIGWLVILIVKVVNLLPEKQAFQLAVCLGSIIYHASGTIRNRILDNLSLVYGPSMSDVSKDDLARTICRNLVRMAVEATRLITMSPEEIKQRVDDNDVTPLFKKSLDNGRSIMIITGHYGNWELFAAYIAQIAALTVLARANENPAIESIILKIRSIHNIRVIDRSHPGAPREMIRMGKEGGHFLGVLMDQDTTRVQGIFSDFMGIPALTPTGPASIAVRNDYDLFIAYLRPEISGQHKLIAKGPLLLDLDGPRTDQIKAATDLFNEHLSEMILEEPQYWAWNHRRWRHRPSTGDTA